MTDNATGTEIDPAIRDRLALALDVDDLVAAIRLGRTFKDYFGPNSHQDLMKAFKGGGNKKAAQA